MRNNQWRTALKCAVFSGVSFIGLSIGETALAQESASEDSAGGDVIVVTAQRRSQNILDVGITMAVADQQALTVKRIESVNDTVEVTSNVTVKDNVPGLVPVLTIRGVGLNDFSATNNPSAGVYVDEVSLSSLALMNFDFFDLQQIEVLKGPQGTLYGRTATAGALNIVSARPDLGGFYGRVAGGIGNFQSRQIEGMLNIPIGETFGLRVAGKGTFQEKGFYFDRSLDRDVGRRDQLMGRISALWEPSDNVDVNLKVEGVRGRSELGSPEFLGAFPTANLPAGVACPGAPQCSDFFGYTDNDGNPYAGDWSVSPDYDLNQMSYTARINVDLGFATLSSVTGYVDFDRSWSADTDGGPLRQLDFLTNDGVKQFSQELRLTKETAVVDWTVGGFYSRDHVVTSYDGNLIDLFNTTTLTTSDQKTHSSAAFANGEWHLSGNLDLVTGLRYTSERRNNIGGTFDLVSQAPGSALSMAAFGSAPVPLAISNAQIKDKNWSWRFGLNWNPDPSTLIYASASQGIKSGGFFAGVATTSAQLTPYEPETLRAYEVGIRGRLQDIGVQYAASVFYYDYNDVQTFIRDTVGTLPIQRLGNVNKAEIYGIDADIAWSPASMQGFSLQLGAGLLHGEFGSFASSNGVVQAGNRLPDAPRFTLSPGAEYEFGLTNNYSARLSVSGRYQSRVFKDALNDPLFDIKGYWALGARATVFGDNGWDFSVWGENLTDKTYVTQGVNNLSLGVGFRVYGAPRTWGVSISKTF